MYEVFPIVAGVIIGLLVPRLVTSAQQRRWVYAFLGIAVAALAGSAFYGLVALIEKRVTFWHPSQRH